MAQQTGPMAPVILLPESNAVPVARGFASREVPAIANRPLRCNDQIGCRQFRPVDTITTRRHHRAATPDAGSPTGARHG